MEWITAMILLYLGSLSICHGNGLSAETDVSASRPSPCRLDTDKAYGGIVVDCQGQGLKGLPPPEWIPRETTSLLLQSNSISHLDNSSFVKATELRYLSLAHNEVSAVDPAALQHNKKIRVIDLESNLLRLDSGSLKGPLFNSINSLEELRLANNDLYPSSTFNPALLAGFPNLRILTLDAFEGDLRFNGIFNQTKRLESLTLSGAMSIIRNNSFEDLETIKLKELSIISVSDLVYTEAGAFDHLKYLDSFHVQDVNQGTTVTLESLAPFVRRNFTNLHFHDLYHDKRFSPSDFQRDFSLDQYTGRYLSKICVKNFVFTENHLFFIEPGILTGPVWSNCLESIDLSKNPLLGNVLELIRLSHLKWLQSFRLTDRKYAFLGKPPSTGEVGRFITKNFNTTVSVDGPIMKAVSHQAEALVISNQNYVSTDDCSNSRRSIEMEETGFKLGFDIENVVNTGENELTTMLTAPEYEMLRKVTEKRSYPLSSLNVTLPASLVYLDLSRMSTHSISLDLNVFVIGGQNLKEFRFSDSGVADFTGSVRGIGNVTIADLSRNDGSSMSSSFLSYFPKLSTLLMSGMSLDKALVKSPNMFHALHKLEHLDLSFNNLHVLPPTLLSNNRNLKHLSLAGNRLTRLSLLLNLNPGLQFLDLRANSFLDFSRSEREHLDQQSNNVPKFELLLEGNVFSCSCSNIQFLRWLQTTHLELDRQTSDYSCLLMDGRVTTTNKLKNLENFWRVCNGKVALYISVIFMCLTAFGFSLFTIGIKFQTQIQATFIQYFGRNFVLKTPNDYATGVYIGYADGDTNFACMDLRDVIENHLQYSTYVRHRDLLPASNLAESIVSAINSSWRVVLFVSEHFLEDQWSYLAMKTATYSVDTSNPGRIVLVVASDDIGHRIPVYLLHATREENIINMGGQHRLSHYDIEALRAALQG